MQFHKKISFNNKYKIFHLKNTVQQTFREIAQNRGYFLPTEVGVVGVDEAADPHKWSIRIRVASFTLEASHSQPLTTAIVV